jgi:hypothetical protein
MVILQQSKVLQIHLAQQSVHHARQLMLVGIHILTKSVRLERLLAHNFM